VEPVDTVVFWKYFVVRPNVTVEILSVLRAKKFDFDFSCTTKPCETLNVKTEVRKFFQWMSESQIVKLHLCKLFCLKSCSHKVKTNEDLFFASPKIANHVWHLCMKFLYETERACLVEVICLPYLLLVESSASP